MLRVSVIIPTYHRPAELTMALRSILAQSRMPDELIVVDDGDLPELPLRAELETTGLVCRFLRKDKPGLTESRNLGIARSRGDVILFVDDDVELLPDYVQQVAAVYERDVGGEIDGVGGVILNHKSLSGSRR